MKLKNIVQGFLSILLGFAILLNLGVGSASAARKSAEEPIPLGEVGHFTVLANNEDGTLVTPNMNTNDYPSYSFTIEGEWNEGPGAELHTCSGSDTFPTSGMTYPDFAAFSLIAENVGTHTPPDTRAYEVCLDPTIAFYGDEVIKFVMNDSPGDYETNQEEMEVFYVRDPNS